MQAYLRHASHHSRNTEAESTNSGNAGWQRLSVAIQLWVVARETLLEEEMVAEGDTLIDGEPVADEVHEVLEDSFEVGVAWDGNGDY